MHFHRTLLVLIFYLSHVSSRRLPLLSLQRLPKKLYPIKYELQIKVYLPGFPETPQNKEGTFEAEVVIKFHVDVSTDRIVLNADGLNFDSYELLGEEHNTTKYSGKMRILSGLYMARYRDENGQERYMASTNLEPMDARKLVPCFDEPEFKSVWKVTVIHPRGTSALSNAIELGTFKNRNDPGWHITTFSETVPMSSYLLAIIVSDFHYREGKTKSGVRIRIWSRKEAISQTKYALETGIKVTEFFENYWGVEYPLPKQDMVAVPDFPNGAMENWGLITYSEPYLLSDPRLYSIQQMAFVPLVIAHELAHQWFGNLVTLKWWDETWLNEGFATLMQNIATAAGESRLKCVLYFAVNSAMVADSSSTAHPLQFRFRKAEDVLESFDDISYKKGASFLYMTEKVLGAENFKNGIKIYLERYKYRNTGYWDLANALEKAYVSDTSTSRPSSTFNIKEYASNWITQPGFPVITVRRLDAKTVELRQSRFLYNPTIRASSRSYIYDVPIWYQLDGVEQPLVWLHRELVNISVPEGSLLVLNSLARGFYRVNYDEPHWLKITEQLINDHTKLDVRTRSMIVSDAFALAEAEMLRYEVALNITRYLRHEKEYLPWLNAVHGLSRIVTFFDNEPEMQYLTSYMRYLMSPISKNIDCNLMERQQKDGSSILKDIWNSLLTEFVCDKNKSESYFESKFLEACNDTKMMSSQCSKVPPNERAATYCDGVKRGSAEILSKVFEFYKKERVQVEQHFLLHGLSCSSDPVVLKRLLRAVTDPKSRIYRKADVARVFDFVESNSVGKLLLFNYFLDNWPTIMESVGEHHNILQKVIKSATVIKTQREINQLQLEQFMKENINVTKRLDVFEAQLEAAKARKLWMDRNFRPLVEWFNSTVPNSVNE